MLKRIIIRVRIYKAIRTNKLTQPQAIKLIRQVARYHGYQA